MGVGPGADRHRQERPSRLLGKDDGFSSCSACLNAGHPYMSSLSRFPGVTTKTVALFWLAKWAVAPALSWEESLISSLWSHPALPPGAVAIGGTVSVCMRSGMTPTAFALFFCFNFYACLRRSFRQSAFPGQGRTCSFLLPDARSVRYSLACLTGHDRRKLIARADRN